MQYPAVAGPRCMFSSDTGDTLAIFEADAFENRYTCTAVPWRFLYQMIRVSYQSNGIRLLGAAQMNWLQQCP